MVGFIYLLVVDIVKNSLRNNHSDDIEGNNMDNKTIHTDASRYPLYNMVRDNHDIRVYIEEQNKSLHALGYTAESTTQSHPPSLRLIGITLR